MRFIAAALVAGISMQLFPAESGALDAAVASRFAKQALVCVEKEYPNKPDHVMNGPEDATGPKAQHPAFYGCFDWHSSVHGHWMLVRVLRLNPDTAMRRLQALSVQGVRVLPLAPLAPIGFRPTIV